MHVVEAEAEYQPDMTHKVLHPDLILSVNSHRQGKIPTN